MYIYQEALWPSGSLNPSVITAVTVYMYIYQEALWPSGSLNPSVITAVTVHVQLSKIVGPVGQKLTRSDLNFFASDPMSGAIFQ
jgi:hypothetical protein